MIMTQASMCKVQYHHLESFQSKFIALGRIIFSPFRLDKRPFEAYTKCVYRVCVCVHLTMCSHSLVTPRTDTPLRKHIQRAPFSFGHINMHACVAH